MKTSQLYNLLLAEQDRPRLPEWQTQVDTLADMILQRMWGPLLQISEGANKAANEIRTGEKRPTHNPHNTMGDGINDLFASSSRDDLTMPHMNLSEQFKTSDGKTGFNLIAANQEQPAPMLFIGVDEDNQPIIWETTTVNLCQWSSEAEAYEMINPQYKEIDISQIEDVITNWTKRYIRPEQLEKMCAAAKHEEIVDSPFPMNILDVGKASFKPEEFKIQTQDAAEKLAYKLKLSSNFVNEIMKTVERACKIHGNNKATNYDL
jgi:hypothetical protein